MSLEHVKHFWYLAANGNNETPYDDMDHSLIKAGMLETHQDFLST